MTMRKTTTILTALCLALGACLTTSCEPETTNIWKDPIEFCGAYNPEATYYAKPDRRSVVEYNGQFYRTAADAPEQEFSGIEPTNTDYWTPMEGYLLMEG